MNPFLTTLILLLCCFQAKSQDLHKAIYYSDVSLMFKMEDTIPKSSKIGRYIYFLYNKSTDTGLIYIQREDQEVDEMFYAITDYIKPTVDGHRYEILTPFEYDSDIPIESYKNNNPYGYYAEFFYEDDGSYNLLIKIKNTILLYMNLIEVEE